MSVSIIPATSQQENISKILGLAKFSSIMAATPAAVGGGGALVFTGGDFIFAFQGNTTAFWQTTFTADSIWRAWMK